MITPDPEGLVLSKWALGIGLSCLGLGTWLLLQELAPRRWPQVNGTIVASRIEFSGGYRASQYLPIIEYEYRYHEQLFKSTRRRAGNYVSGEQGRAEAMIERYPIDSSVRVFIHPKQPAVSALEYGINFLSLVPLGFGILLTSLATLFFFGK
jgi:hypothetical protein